MGNTLTTTPKKNGEMIKPKKKTFRAIFAADHLLGEIAWLVTIGCKKESNHAFLLIEGIEAGRRKIFKADLVMDSAASKKFYGSGSSSPSSSSLSSTSISHVNAKVRFEPKAIDDFDDLQTEYNEETCYYKCCAITAEEAQNLITAITSDETKSNSGKIKYNYFGDGCSYSLSYSGKEYHNCVSWAFAKLEQIGIQVPSGVVKTLVKIPSTLIKEFEPPVMEEDLESQEVEIMPPRSKR